MDTPSRQSRPPDTVYHGTDCQFDQFALEHCLGAHFGTEKAALDRLRSTGKLRIEYLPFRQTDGSFVVREQIWSNKAAFDHGPFAGNDDAQGFMLHAPPHREPRQFEIDVIRPLPMPDLGTWTFEIVMQHLQDEGILVATTEIWDAWNLGSERGWTSLKAALSNEAYDCICYTNATEDPGSVSWIVFDPKRIHAKWRPGQSQFGNNPQLECEFNDQHPFERERMRA